MNKKGFSLVEIMGVIVIIGILSGIGILAVNKYINNSKTKTYQNYESNLKGAVINYLSEYSEMLPSNGTVTIYANTLINHGFLPKLKDPVNQSLNCFNSNTSKDSYVKVTASRASGAYNPSVTYKVCLKCSAYKTSGC